MIAKPYLILNEETLVDKARKMLGFPKPNPNDIADKLRPRYQGDYSLLNLVGMNEATISIHESPRPIIGSYGMGFCIAMAGYDPHQKIGFISHNVHDKYVERLHDLVLEELRKRSKGELELEIYLVGGMVGSNELASRLRKYARENFNPRIINEDLALDILEYTYLGKSFLLDTRDGTTHSIDGGGQLRFVPSAEPRISVK